MKRITALLLAAALVCALCACAKTPAQESPAATPVVTDQTAEELTYKLLSCPLTFTRSDGEEETLCLTSVTLRAECSVCTFLRQPDAVSAAEFPKMTARTASGGEFSLTPELVGSSSVGFAELDGLPVKEISSLVCGDQTIDLTNIQNNSAQFTDLYTAKLNTLQTMSYNELFSFCLGSDGAFAEGAYGELARRMVADPEEFAMQLKLPAYPIEGSAKSFFENAQVQDNFYEAYGFDDATDDEICRNICAACLAPDVEKVISTLSSADGEQYRSVADKLSAALLKT